MSFDPRTIATPIYEALHNLRSLPNQDDTRLKQQKKSSGRTIYLSFYLGNNAIKSRGNGIT
ncbi:hypothetical protein [Aphanizomenon flos-aquae]|uniref:hypothetical protein n=1 Tax=Aphanizomenon flos-aquae TaxID=1176 RepID=UPI000A6B305C|nr:hypothetical protein [Aphanizomenon flos-aquae]